MKGLHELLLMTIFKSQSGNLYCGGSVIECPFLNRRRLVSRLNESLVVKSVVENVRFCAVLAT